MKLIALNVYYLKTTTTIYSLKYFVLQDTTSWFPSKYIYNYLFIFVGKFICEVKLISFKILLNFFKNFQNTLKKINFKNYYVDGVFITGKFGDFGVWFVYLVF